MAAKTGSKRKPSTSTKRLKDAKPVFNAVLHQGGNRRLSQPEVYQRPTMLQLLKRNSRWVHKCITINAQTAAGIRPRLFTIGNKEVVEKAHWLKPKPVDARTKAYLRGRMCVSPSVSAQKKYEGNIDDLTEVTDHPALMLLDNVNEWEEGFGFRESWYYDLQLFGRFFTSIVADQSNVPVALWRMLPHYCVAIPSNEGGPAAFEYGSGVNKVILTPDEVFWLKQNDAMNPWGGHSPTEAFLQSIDADASIVAFQEWVFNSGGTPDVLIISKAGLTEDQKRVFRKDWRARFGGMNNSKRDSIAFVGGETTVEQLSHTPKDMEYVKGREISRDEICNAFGVPKALVTSDDVNLANAREGSISHQRNTIWPLICRVEDAINQRLLMRWSDRLVLIHDNPIAEDKTIRIQERDSKLRAGYSINELRAEDGDEALDDPQADVPMISSDLIPLSMAGMSAMGGLGGLMGAPGLGIPSDATSESGAEGASPEAQAGALAPGSEPVKPNEQLPEGMEAGQIETTEAMVLNGAQITAATAIVVSVASGEQPRDSGIGQLIVLFNLTPEQAELIMGSAGTNKPTTPNPNPKEEAEREADLASAEANAQGRMNANGGAGGNPGKSAATRFGNDGGVESLPLAKSEGQNANALREPGQSQGEAAGGLGGAGSVATKSGNDGGGDDAASCVSQQSEIFKAWEGVEHESCCHQQDKSVSDNEGTMGLCDDDGRRAGASHSGEGRVDNRNTPDDGWASVVCSTFAAKCFALHIKDSPQEDLPDSGSIRGFKTRMEKVLRDQNKAAQEAIRASIIADAAVIAAINEITKPVWVERIAEASRPFLQRGVEIGGNFGMEKLGLPDAVGFDVTNPEVQRFVDNYNVRLANGINQYTEVAARDLLGNGLEKGETIPDLVERVQDWAGKEGDVTRGTGARAENIARTESARAYVKGEQEAWKQSGVVERKQWMLAADGCEFCQAAAAAHEGKSIALSQAFFAKGTVLQGTDGGMMKLDYEAVDGPPLHPQCRCDLIPILEGE
jgi:HK97 family phage portal protein